MQALADKKEKTTYAVDRKRAPWARKCWTAEFIEAREGPRASNRYTNCVKAAIPLPLQDLKVDLRERLHAV